MFKIIKPLNFIAQILSDFKMPQICPGVTTQVQSTASSFFPLHHSASQAPVRCPRLYIHVCLLWVGTHEGEALAVNNSHWDQMQNLLEHMCVSTYIYRWNL